MNKLFGTVILAILLAVSSYGQVIPSTCVNGRTPVCVDDQTITNSGQTLPIKSNGGLTPTFEYIISGAPVTVSIVVSGCGTVGTCETLDTYTTVANVLRNPTVTKPYDHYNVVGSWTGGSNVTIRVNTHITTANSHAGGGGITQLTGGVTTPSSSSGSTVATVVDLPGNVSLTGTPSAGKIPTATDATDATWQSPAPAANSPMYELLPNDPTGTGANLLACWVGTNVHQQTVQTCPVSNVNGTDNNYPIVGVCVSGCGTTGYATIQFAGSVSWLCDGTVTTTEYWVQPSTTVAGECYQPIGTFAPSPNENPEGNTVLGRVLAGNTGLGTAATISLLPFGSYGLANSQNTGEGGVGTFTNYALLMNSSNFGSMSHNSQAPSTDYIPYAFTGRGMYIYAGGSGRYIMIGAGNLPSGASGSDVNFDSLTNGPGGPPIAMFRFNGGQYQVPSNCYITVGPCTGVSGTITLGNHNSEFDVGNSTGLYMLTLAGNATTYTPNTDDNAGHILTFVITPNSYTWTWPSGTPAFVNAPSVANSTIPITTQFVFDGTNYNCVLNCATSTPISMPSWLAFLGSGADGAEVCNGNLTGDFYYTTFSVPFGDTCTVSGNGGLVIHATGACTIAGTITGAAATSTTSIGGGASAGSGGGAAAGIAGTNTWYNAAGTGVATSGSGSAGGISGGAGGNVSSTTVTATAIRAATVGVAASDGLFLAGAPGKAGGSTGGTGGNGGSGVTLICQSITGTDGTHTGVITLNGVNGGNAPGNNTGAGSGGGGGVFIGASQAVVTTWPTVSVAAGTTGSCGAFTGCGIAGLSAAGWYAEFAAYVQVH